MAGRPTERSKSRCDSVPPIFKGKLAHQIYLRARYFASRGIKTLGQEGLSRTVRRSGVSNISFLPGCPEGASFETHNGTCIECLRRLGIVSTCAHRGPTA